MKIAVCQIACPAPDAGVGVIETAARAGARLIVLPELANADYADPLPAAESADGPTVAAWVAAARRLGVHIVGGFCEAGGPYDSAALVGPRGLVGVYRKVHLFAGERELFRAGASLPLWETELGRIGVLVCYDLRFVEAVRALALRGADAICVPTTWTGLHKAAATLWDAQGHSRAGRTAAAHAYLNRCYLACADRVGPAYLGASLIAGPDGETLAGPAPAADEATLLADYDPRLARDKSLGPDNDLWRDRRPGVYGMGDLRPRNLKWGGHGLGPGSDGADRAGDRGQPGYRPGDGPGAGA